jgi:oligoendopeptidase F
MAVGAMLRDGHARLRTRVGPAGMDYKGYNIAVHELGHTVEQVFSMSRIDHTLLQGVPNTGFTEAFAFLFQARDLELIDRAPPPDPQADALRAIDRVWDAFEIAGVALIDVEIWRWMYEHPAATPAEVREAMVAIARDVWNRYYAPVFGVRDSTILAIYSHIIAYGLYTPDYLIGMVITAQVEDYVRSRDLATEMERMCVLGRLAPDVWMQQAVGAPVTADALLDAAGAALEQGVR